MLRPPPYLLLCACSWLAGTLGCSQGGSHHAAPRDPIAPAAAAPSAPVSASADGEAALREVCSRCHVFPEPSTLPRDRWPSILAAMYGYHSQLPEHPSIPSGASLEDAGRYYAARAPERLEYPALLAAPDPLRFAPAPGLPSPAPFAAGVTHFQLGPTKRPTLVSDTFGGAIYQLDPKPHVIANLHAPARFVTTDLDADGREDLIVADLGSFLDVDTRLGEVRWLRGGGPGRYESIALLREVGRVADVAVADFDRDGDLDVAVAIFGVLRGSVSVLVNRGSSAGRPTFDERTIDTHDGAVDVEWADLDGDGALELVAALSQQHERVMAYQLGADGSVSAHTLAAASHPAWGTSGIQVGDLDADGDVDVLWINGDVALNHVVPAEQGVHWLENAGAFEFRRHFLAFLAGAHTCRAHDLDRDGDLDIVAAAALPWPGLFPEPLAGPVHGPSLIWLEQTQRRLFVAHVIESDHARHTWIELGDYDADGYADIFVGELDPLSFRATKPRAKSSGAWISVWRNQRGAR